MTLHRRELLLVGAGAVAAKATASTLACAQDQGTNNNERRSPAGTKPEAKPAPKAEPTPHANHGKDAAANPSAVAFAAAVAECSALGEACLQHCIARLSAGDTSMAECASAVNDMLAICRGVGTLAHSGSTHLSAAVKVCTALCTDCAAACKPHAEHHAACKACHDACERTVKAGVALLG